jgi:diguanylate cyclase (GGDEF)-like protein/PAS domain S-box-containing protein
MRDSTSTQAVARNEPGLAAVRQTERCEAARHAAVVAYLRDKVNQLLQVVGTFPLQPEALDDDTLISLDPIGIIAESFGQILLHLRETNEEISLAHDETRAIIEAAGTAIVVVDREARVLGFNRRSHEYFLPHVQEPAGTIEQPPLPKPDEAFFGVVVRTAMPMEHRDLAFGDRHFHLVATPVPGPAGEVERVVLAYTDVTARIEAEERLKTILESLPVGVLVVDAATHTVIDVNSSATRMLGRRRPEIVGNVCHKFVCPADTGQCPITDRGQTVDNSERSVIHADGRLIPVMKTVTTVMLDGRRVLLESFIDISRRKQAEAALQDSEQRYRSLYSTMKEGVALHEIERDADGVPVDYVVLDVNPAYERILGMTRDDVIGARGSQVYGIGDPPYLDGFAEVVRTGEPMTFETEFRGRQMYISVVRPSDGKFATIFDDITERKRAEQQVQHLAYSDTLTGLPNRALLMHQLRDALARCERDGTQLAVLFLDLDRFKPINDTMGHAVGDELLKAVAQRLRNAVRRSDTVSRLGGDEFVVVLGGIRGHREATRAAQEILDRIAEPFACDQHEIFSSMSIGIAIYPADGRDAGTLLKSADMAMYVAKQRGRGNYQFYSHQMNQAAQERLELENSLRRALKQQEFSLWYQPQVNLDDGRVTGVEALIRWHHPELGIVPPGLFIPACEEIGLILPLGEWVMRSACRQAKAWTRAGHPPIRMAVNLSLVQFRQSDLAQRVRTIVEETAVDPACIELELTESMIMEDAEATVRTLRELKAMGLRLAIDDFGTGYSSLSYLSSFPIDRIKIAQRFVTDVAGDPRSAAIVETIIAIARSLGIEVIAEGVETARQLEFLRSRGCVELQGYYFSRPVPGDALTARLAEWLGPAGCCPVGVA